MEKIREITTLSNVTWIEWFDGKSTLYRTSDRGHVLFKEDDFSIKKWEHVTTRDIIESLQDMHLKEVDRCVLG